MRVTDRGDRRWDRAVRVGAQAGALVGLVMLAYVFRHISERPVGWASTNSDGREDHGLKVFFLVFGGFLATLTGGTIGAAVGRGVSGVVRGWTIPQVHLVARLAATWVVAAVPLVLPRGGPAWTTADVLRCAAVSGALCSALWLVAFAIRLATPDPASTNTSQARMR